MGDDIKCPYCGAGEEINHDDGYGLAEGTIHEQECGVCGDIFVYTTHISFNYDVARADCKNGSPHLYDLTHTFPEYAPKIRCSMCGEEI